MSKVASIIFLRSWILSLPVWHLIRAIACLCFWMDLSCVYCNTLQTHRSCRLGSQHGLRCKYTTITHSVTHSHACWRISHRKTMPTCVDMARWNAWIGLCSCSFSPTTRSRFCGFRQYSTILTFSLAWNNSPIIRKVFVREMHSCQLCNLNLIDFNDANWKFQDQTGYCVPGTINCHCVALMSMEKNMQMLRRSSLHFKCCIMHHVGIVMNDIMDCYTKAFCVDS